MAVFKRLLGACVCGRETDKCTCPRTDHYYYKITDPLTGKRPLKSTFTTDIDQARAMERQAKKALISSFRQEFLDFDAKMRRGKPEVTLDEILAAIGKRGKLHKSSEILKRNIGSLWLFCGRSTGIMMPNPGVAQGGLSGVKIGEMIADRKRLGKMPLAKLLTFDGVLSYFRNESGGELDWVTEVEENRSINSTLAQARCVFSKQALMFDFRDLDLPDISEFMTCKPLPEPDLNPNPVEGPQFAKMIEARRYAPSEVALWNRIATQTGMRPGSILELQSSWCRRVNTGWAIDIKKGKTSYTLPITDEIAEIIQSRDGYVLAGTAQERRRTMNAHNDWLKSVIGAPVKGQGSYRLRKTAACIVQSLYGKEAVIAMLGHCDDKSLKHYSQTEIYVTPEMANELRASQRLLKSNVIPMTAAA